MKVPTTARDVITALPSLLSLDGRDELTFLRYARMDSGDKRASAAPDEQTRAAELLRHADTQPADLFTMCAADISDERLDNEERVARAAGKLVSVCSKCRLWNTIVVHVLMQERRDCHDRE